MPRSRRPGATPLAAPARRNAAAEIVSPDEGQHRAGAPGRHGFRAARTGRGGARHRRSAAGLLERPIFPRPGRSRVLDQGRAGLRVGRVDEDIVVVAQRDAHGEQPPAARTVLQVERKHPYQARHLRSCRAAQGSGRKCAHQPTSHAGNWNGVADGQRSHSANQAGVSAANASSSDQCRRCATTRSARRLSHAKPRSADKCSYRSR